MISEPNVTAYRTNSSFQENAMRVAKLSLAVLVLGSLCAGAAAQAEPVSPEPVIRRIPAEAMGFVMVRDIRAMTDGMDKFLDDIGLGEMVREQMPDGLLAMIKEQVDPGEGFKPDGGFAIAVMDFQQFGFEIPEQMDGGLDDAMAMLGEMPFAVWVPASSIEGLLPESVATEQVGGYTAVSPDGLPVLAMEHDGYVVFSMRADVLDAVQADGPTAEDELSADEKAVLGKADIAGYINMQIAGPFMEKLLESAEQQMLAGDAMGQSGPAAMFGPEMSPENAAKLMEWNRRYISQIEGMLVAGRFVDEGLVFEHLMRFVPDSTLGRIMAAHRRVRPELVDRLPDMPYVLAAGVDGRSEAPEAEQEYLSEYLDMIGDLLGEDVLSADAKSELERILLGFNEQVTNAQFVVGAAPEDAGVFSLGVVMQSRDADATTALVMDSLGHVENLIKGFAPPGEAEDLRIRHNEAVETIRDVGIDTVELTHPDLEQMPEYEKEEMAAVLGEAKVQFRMAKPDDQTLVVSFGGGAAFMEEMLKMTAGEGPIPTHEGTQTAMKYMPDGTSALVLFNLKNLFTAIERGSEALMGPGMMPPLEFEADVPLTAAMAVTEDGSSHSVAFIPSEMVRDIVTAALETMAPAQPHPHDPYGPMEGAEDF